MTNLSINGVNYSIPSKWNELTKEQLLYISEILLRKYDVDKFNIFVFRYITGIPWTQFVRIFKNNAPVLAEIIESLEFIHNKNTLTVNLFPTIEIDKIKLIGPADGLQDTVFEEFFLYTENSFANYFKTKEESHLNILIASLYRKEYNGIPNCREPFNPHTVENRITLIEKLTPELKNCILLFYSGCRNLIMASFPDLFKEQTKTVKDSLSYLKLIDRLSNGAVVNNESVKQTNVYEVCVRLREMQKETEELQNQLNKSNHV